ncbi:MAG: hypothetical protein HQ583_04725 [Candidatus Abyssubacteria bacterium]|nr:hypothetical protein [Candidatus Abyssubacteria bacterium]
MQHLGKNCAFHFQVFSSDSRPQAKKDGPWWEQEKEYAAIAPDKESEYQDKLMGELTPIVWTVLAPK